MAKGGPEKRLTPDEIDRIVELRLNRITYKAIASEVGCNIDTAVRHWNNWLDETSVERREQMERKRTEVIARLDSTAANARRGALRARSELPADEAAKAEARFLAEERQALIGLARVAGYDAPIQVSGRVELSDEEAREVLRKLPARSRERLGL
jgi:hypothetical protein